MRNSKIVESKEKKRDGKLYKILMIKINYNKKEKKEINNLSANGNMSVLESESECAIISYCWLGTLRQYFPSV